LGGVWDRRLSETVDQKKKMPKTATFSNDLLGGEGQGKGMAHHTKKKIEWGEKVPKRPTPPSQEECIKKERKTSTQRGCIFGKNTKKKSPQRFSRTTWKKKGGGSKFFWFKTDSKKVKKTWTESLMHCSLKRNTRSTSGFTSELGNAKTVRRGIDHITPKSKRNKSDLIMVVKKGNA